MFTIRVRLIQIDVSPRKNNLENMNKMPSRGVNQAYHLDPARGDKRLGKEETIATKMVTGGTKAEETLRLPEVWAWG